MATAYTPQHDDPFAPTTKTPSLSWKGLTIGATFVLQVLESAKMLHSRNFDTNEPDYWDEEKTQPKMSAVVNVRVMSGPHSVGEERSVWAQKPSDLFTAIAAAQQTAGSKIATGGTLHLRFRGETPHAKPRMNPIKHYEAKYEPPTAADAFSAEAPVSQPRYAQPAQPAQQAPVGWPSRLPAAQFARIEPEPVGSEQPTIERQPDNPNVAPKTGVRW